MASQIGIYLKELGRLKFLTAAQERECYVLAKAGDVAARNRMIESCAALVVAIARRYEGRGVPLDELVQVGNFAMFRVAKYFNPDRGRLTTIATVMVRQAIKTEIKRGRFSIRLPNPDRKLKEKTHAAMLRLAAKLRNAVQPEPSLDEHGLSPAGNEIDPLERLIAAEEARKIKRQLRKLDPRYREVLLRRCAGESLVILASSLGITKERVRQIERRAIQMLAFAFGELPADSLNPRRKGRQWVKGRAS